MRVNQLGYPPGAGKRAYLMSNVPESGASLTVQREGGWAAFSGTVGASSGKWSKAYPYVYPLDFDAPSTSGIYRLLVGGSAPATSPPFPVAPAASLYAPALTDALSFYENERDGPEYVPSALRTAPAHLADASAMSYQTPKTKRSGRFKGDLRPLGTTVNASGGWWDAGDYLKFVQTTSYTVDLMLAGVRDFPAAMGEAASGTSFAAEARFGIEWLLRMWDDETATLYYQVGIGEGNSDTVGDHDLWRLPQADDGFGGDDPLYRYIRHRPVFRARPAGSEVSPNLAGRLAAAFALCYEDFHQSHQALADRCLRAGEHVFGLADTHPRGHLLTVIPFSFYLERQWTDDLELGASELALALRSGGALPGGLAHTEPSFYLQAAAGWARSYLEHPRRSEGLNLYDVSALAHYELARGLRQAGKPTGLAVSEAELLAGLRAKLQDADRAAAHDPFGFGFPWNQADTASHGDGLAVMAAEYDWLTAGREYAAQQARWLGNVLGANAWGASLIIGDGSLFPHCPQHQVANLAGSLDGSPPVLAGAVVEGPSDEASSGEVEGMRTCGEEPATELARFDGSGAVFHDDVQSFTTVEPAIDLTASSMLAFSWAVQPTPAPLP